MRHRRPLIWIVTVLVGGAVLLFFMDPWSTLRNVEGKVALRNMEAVDRIVLEDVYDSTELVKVDGTWMLYGEEACNQGSVENLLIAASRLQISSVVSLDSDTGPVAGEGSDAEAGPAGGRAVRRITWYKGDRVLLSMGFATSESGRYLVIPPGSGQAYYVAVAGYPKLNLDKVFSSASNHYRKHILIDLLPSEISQIGVDLPSGEAFRFLQDSVGNIRMKSEGNGVTLDAQDMNELAIRLLFSYFTSIRYESRSGIPSDSLMRSGSESPLLATLHVRSFAGEDHLLRIYPYHETPGAEPHLFKALAIYNQEPEALLINYIYLDVLMRGLSHYLRDQ